MWCNWKMSDKELKRFAGEAHAGSDNTAPYPVSRMAPSVELVDLAREIERADDMLGATATARLRVIADQVKALQSEARKVLEQTRRDQDLHRAQCNFKRIPGRVYHLYRRGDGRLLFSMLAPDDWGGTPPYAFEGSYRLENDMSWTPSEELDTPDDTGELVARLLGDSS